MVRIKDYPPDFFDCVMIDECHRAGAKHGSEWRGILEYFAPAVQIGLTATPKRRDNVDTYLASSNKLFGLKAGGLLLTMDGLSQPVPAYAPPYWDIRQCLLVSRDNPYFVG